MAGSAWAQGTALDRPDGQPHLLGSPAVGQTRPEPPGATDAAVRAWLDSIGISHTDLPGAADILAASESFRFRATDRCIPVAVCGLGKCYKLPGLLCPDNGPSSQFSQQNDRTPLDYEGAGRFAGIEDERHAPTVPEPDPEPLPPTLATVPWCQMDDPDPWCLTPLE